MLLLIFTFILQVSPLNDIQLRKDVGSMLMIGFRGLTVTDTSTVIQQINANFIGSVVLFDYDLPSSKPVRNVESPTQVKMLTKELQRLTGGQLLIAVDQEGGIIQRFKEKHGFKRFLSAAELGEQNDTSFTTRQAGLLAAELKSVGVNLNLAPVVDVNTNSKNPVIAKYDRSFSPEWGNVSSQAEAFIRGHKRAGVGTTLKHFPGHGSSTIDSHYGVVDVSKTWSELELKPYEELIAKGLVDVVMTAHVFLNKYDKAYPATLSKPIVTGLLRDELNFQGVVLSDDMNMKAISEQYGLEKSIELSINAGVDILVFGNNLGQYDPHLAQQAAGIMMRLVQTGKIKRERIASSAKRIKKLKERLLSNQADL
jgi:beta-N-acetylhexosaminidase